MSQASSLVLPKKIASSSDQSTIADHATGTQQATQNEKNARRFWVGAIVGLLSLQVIGGTITVYLAVGDPTVAVVPNYYQAGLDWDIKRRNLDQFIAMGWQVEMIVQPVDPDAAHRQLRVRLTRGNNPVAKQKISGTVFHHARGNELRRFTMDEAGSGEYVASTALTQAGKWEFNLIVEGDHGIAETRFTMNVDSQKVSTQTDRGDSDRADHAGT